MAHATLSPHALPFLLHDAVLVPGATLGLRVFAVRAPGALLREAGRSGGGFGVCLSCGRRQARWHDGVRHRGADRGFRRPATTAC